MSTSTDPIIEAAVRDGYFNSLTNPDKGIFILDPAGWIAGHPFIQNSYVDLWNTYQQNLNDHGQGVAQTTSNPSTISPANTTGSTNTPPSMVDYGGGVTVPNENPSFNFESMFPKQTAQLIDLGNVENQLQAEITALQNSQPDINSKLSALGSADNTLSTALNNEISYANTKFADIDAKLSSLGTSVTQASSAGSSPLTGVTNFFSSIGLEGTSGIIIAVVIIFVIIMIMRR